MTNAAPIAPLKPSQSLSYLEAGQVLECTADLPPFAAGRSYVVRPFDIMVRRTVKRPAVSGAPHEHTLTGEDLGIAVTDGAHKDWLFVDRRHIGPCIVITINGRPIRPHFDLDALVEHFDVPAPPDIATLNPEHYAYNLAFLAEFERIVNTRLIPLPLTLTWVARTNNPSNPSEG